MEDLLDTHSMHPRDQITLVMHRIYKRVLTTTSGGNISILDENGDIWITPTGVDKGLMKPSDIVCVKADGTVIGEQKPSSEYPFHLAIYNERPDIKAVIHAHPPGLVAFSIVRKIPDTCILPQLYFLCDKIGYATYNLPGTSLLGDNIASEFKKGFSIVIMENHGIVVGSENISDGYQKLESLEISSRSMIYAKMLGHTNSLSASQLDNYAIQFPNVQPELGHFSYSSLEREKRLEVYKIVQRACRQGLMLAGYGAISTRTEGNDFVITPDEKSKWDLRLEDMVQIRNGKKEHGKTPEASAHLHQSIYERHPDINAIILTQPEYLTAFAITGTGFNVRTIPETWIYLQDVQMVEFGDQFAGRNVIPSIVSKETPVVIVKNQCVVVTGNKLLQAFDYLEVAEFSAKSLTLSASLGKMIPISDEQVDELGKVMSRWKNYEWKM